MLIYWSLFFWTFIAWWLYLSAPRYVNISGGVEPRVSRKHIIIGFAPLIFFAGMKGGGIIDSGAYISSYNHALSSLADFNFDWASKSIGFDFLEVLFKSTLGLHYQYWIFFIALVSCIGVIIPIYRHSSMFGLSLFLFIASAQFAWLFNGVRQFLAVTILFANMDLITNKKFWKFLVVTFIAYTIHNTAIIMLPIYFLTHLKLYSRQFGIFTLLFLIISFFIEKFSPLADFFLTGTAYENTFEKALEYEGTSIFRLLVAAIPVLLAFIYRKKLEPLITPSINIVINMAVFNFGVFVVSTTAGGNLFGRLSIYFAMYNLIALPWLIQKCFDNQTRKIITFLAVIFYTLWFVFQVAISWNLPYNSRTLGIYL